MGIFDFLKRISSGNAGNIVTLQTARKIRDDWENVEILLKGNAPSQLKQAVITADKILDNALKDLVAGQTMGERLKNFRDRIDRGSYNRMWEAHKLRNSMVHELNFDPQHFVLREAVSDIKNVLLKMGVKL
jgi:hypothetical protein